MSSQFLLDRLEGWFNRTSLLEGRHAGEVGIWMKGLHFWVDGWEGPYAFWTHHGFAEFRSRLASVIGFTLQEMQGYGGEKSWKGMNSGGLGELFRLPDSGGVLSARVCGRLAPNLESVLDRLERDEVRTASDAHDLGTAHILTTMMRFSAEQGRPLELREV